LMQMGLSTVLGWNSVPTMYTQWQLLYYVIWKNVFWQIARKTYEWQI
jgi:hypothetical protein